MHQKRDSDGISRATAVNTDWKQVTAMLKFVQARDHNKWSDKWMDVPQRIVLLANVVSSFC